MKLLLLSFIFLIGILGKIREYFEWQCPSTLGKCPKGCAPQKKDKFNCSKGIKYVAPKQCARMNVARIVLKQWYRPNAVFYLDLL